MTKWEYKTVIANRGGKQEESGVWTYTSWELLGTDKPGAQAFLPALQELGGQGWELVTVLPTDIWTEGTRTPNTSHGVRTITYSLLFKRPIEESE
ncbi:MAG: hypothetical protein JXA87_13790 [Thermoleophilia bacterium]|nr:hypothetical protein [Thermoleophilia bacterium]